MDVSTALTPWEKHLEPLAPSPTPPKFRRLKLGLHFGLDENFHHDDPALGSTDLRRCSNNPFNYWFGSWMNPTRKRSVSTDAQVAGHAMHKLTFEGEAAFDCLFMRGPDQSDMSQAEKTASTKAANLRAAAAGKTSLKADVYDRTVLAAKMVTANPKTARAFVGGASEVTFIAEVDGMRLKARWDYIKCGSIKDRMLLGLGDLKGCANQYENDFETECYNAIARYGYHVQAAHYVDMTALLPEAIRNGQVYGNFDDDLLTRIANFKAVGWQWVFHQTENAPITWTMKLSPGSPLLQAGRDRVCKAIERYREMMEKFGPDRMWIIADEGDVPEAEIERMPGYWRG